MTCRAARALLPLFAGGDLDEGRRQAVAGHVAGCAVCAGALDEYREARGLLSSATLSFSASDRALVRQRVRDEIARRGERALPFAGFPRLSWPVLVTLAVAGFLLVAASLVSPLVRRDARERAPLVATVPALHPPPAPIPAADRVAAAKPPASRRPPGRERVSAVDAPSVVRLEFQTRNANVRIIWFGGAPSASKKNVS